MSDKSSSRIRFAMIWRVLAIVAVAALATVDFHQAATAQQAPAGQKVCRAKSIDGRTTLTWFCPVDLKCCYNPATRAGSCGGC